MMENKYKKGVTLLLERLGSEHQRYTDVLILQARLLKNIEDTNRFGETEARRAEWAQIVNTLNQLALSTMEVSFNDLCEEASTQPQQSHPSSRIRSARLGFWGSVFRLPTIARGAIVAAVLLVVLFGTLRWHVMERWITFWLPTLSPATMRLADADVSFTVTSSAGEEEIPTHGTLTLAPGDSVSVEVNVTVGQAPFPRDLTYQYFAPEGNVSEELTGPYTAYSAPEQSAADVIVVLIVNQQTGDEVLRYVNVVATTGEVTGRVCQHRAGFLKLGKRLFLHADEFRRLRLPIGTTVTLAVTVDGSPHRERGLILDYDENKDLPLCTIRLDEPTRVTLDVNDDVISERVVKNRPIRDFQITVESVPVPDLSSRASRGRVCKYKNDFLALTSARLFLHPDEFDRLGLPIGARVTVTTTVDGTPHTASGLLLDRIEDEEIPECTFLLNKTTRIALGVDADVKIEEVDDRPIRDFAIITKP